MLPSMESKNKKDTSQCTVSDVDASMQLLNLSKTRDCCSHLSKLPDDVMLTVLLYVGPKDVDESVKLVNHRLFRSTSLSSTLWREFCIITGKCLDKRYANAKGDRDVFTFSRKALPPDANHGLGKDSPNKYRTYYFRNPSVPIDFDSIAMALKHCPRTPAEITSFDDEAEEFLYSQSGTVCLMPGVYKERIIVKGEVWGVGGSVHKVISIRASFPQKGARILHYDEAQGAKNQPCISVSTRDTETLEGVQKGITVKLSYLNIVHCTKGSDIWGGNSAIMTEGSRAQLLIDNCVIQSHSGRGLVVTNQAEIQMTLCSVVDCAATGLYVGDWGSRVQVSKCNVIRNGFGSRKLRSSDEGRQDLDNVLTEWTRLREDANAGVIVARQRFDEVPVPSGHSGIYIEGAMCWIDDTLIASNCLTGASVVRNGFLSLSGCDITQNSGNGHPILIEDEHDIGNIRLQGARIRGGVVEGPHKNSYSNSCGYQEKLRDDALFSYLSVTDPMTEEELLKLTS